MIQDFFVRHQESLQKLHPGLTLASLKGHLGPSPTQEQLGQLLQGAPIQYIGGRAFFFGLSLSIGPGVFIPRPESEVLVELALGRIKAPDPQFADLGTGSGCLALGILSRLGPHTRPWALLIDSSFEAINAAKKNWAQLSHSLPPGHGATFFCSEGLREVPDNSLDFVITNPPYIKSRADRHLVHPQVLAHEPATAIFLDDDQYGPWYTSLFWDFQRAIRPGGFFVMEASEHHVEGLLRLAQGSGAQDLEIHKDLAGRQRFLLGTKGKESIGPAGY